MMPIKIRFFSSWNLQTNTLQANAKAAKCIDDTDGPL